MKIHLITKQEWWVNDWCSFGQDPNSTLYQTEGHSKELILVAGFNPDRQYQAEVPFLVCFTHLSEYLNCCSPDGRRYYGVVPKIDLSNFKNGYEEVKNKETQ